MREPLTAIWENMVSESAGSSAARQAVRFAVETNGWAIEPRPPGPRVSVIVPTRNEAGNVDELVQRLSDALDVESLEWELVFADDSDDGTPDMVRRLQRGRPQIRLVHRPATERHGGLSGAVRRGLADASGSVLVVMDADLQHPPEILPSLVAPVVDGTADLAVGTRYGHGGDTAGLGGRYRRGVSGACRAAVHLLVPRSRLLSDPLSGLFAVNAAVLDGVRLQGQGFKILLEIVAHSRWDSCINVPYVFAERRTGTSKADLREGIVFVRHLTRVSMTQRLRRSARAASSAA